ncbi:MAG: cytochrome c biogenesis CcdA family protein [Eubacteriaceae bacterium]|jgi:cytochrome c-type biogenesis protein|nr:cytochrome c-type biosis protein [Eubacteriaceae bacterium]
MEYLIAFLEGMITFISPCLLPMLPVYISFLAGQQDDNKKSQTLVNAFGFVLGFTLVFVLLGAFSASLGQWLSHYSSQVNLIAGLVVILFGLQFMGILKIPLLNRSVKLDHSIKNVHFLSAILFGMIFSIGWTPCVGAFLGSALMLAASSGQTLKGMLMLLSFSLGMGIPFILSALVIDQLKAAFDFIKKHYQLINRISGAFLILIGILMATGLFNSFLSILTL